MVSFFLYYRSSTDVKIFSIHGHLYNLCKFETYLWSYLHGWKAFSDWSSLVLGDLQYIAFYFYFWDWELDATVCILIMESLDANDLNFEVINFFIEQNVIEMMDN